MEGRVPWVDRVLGFLLQRPVVIALIVINLAAGVVGAIYWYGPELLATPWWAFIFVPDSPMFTFLFAVALIGIAAGRQWPLLNAIAAVGCIKYGIWAITVWILYWSAGYSATIESITMSITHLGLLLQGVLLLFFLRGLRWPHVLLVGALFFLADWVDYGLGFHPRMAPGVDVTIMMWEMLILTAGLTAFLGWLVWRRQGTRPSMPARPTR